MHFNYLADPVKMRKSRIIFFIRIVKLNSGKLKPAAGELKLITGKLNFKIVCS